MVRLCRIGAIADQLPIVTSLTWVKTYDTVCMGDKHLQPAAVLMQKPRYIHQIACGSSAIQNSILNVSHDIFGFGSSLKWVAHKDLTSLWIRWTIMVSIKDVSTTVHSSRIPSPQQQTLHEWPWWTVSYLFLLGSHNITGEGLVLDSLDQFSH